MTRRKTTAKRQATAWDPETVARFEAYLLAEAARAERHRHEAEVGDTVETPDGRLWLVVRVRPSDQLDLQTGEGDVLSVPREFVRVVEKA